MNHTWNRRAALWALTCCTAFGAVAGWAAAAQKSPSIAKDARLFEMRTYYAADGKLEDLHARFRNHTNRLFQKHGIDLVGYWVPTDKDKGADNTLIYIVAFPSKEARDASFAKFIQDPEWIDARNASEVNGRLVDRIDSVFLNAVDYSPIK